MGDIVNKAWKMLKDCKELADMRKDNVNLMVLITAWYNMGIVKGIEKEKDYDEDDPNEAFGSKEVAEAYEEVKARINLDDLKELCCLLGIKHGIIMARGSKSRGEEP